MGWEIIWRMEDIRKRLKIYQNRVVYYTIIEWHGLFENS
jgi:hypothetical protein